MSHLPTIDNRSTEKDVLSNFLIWTIIFLQALIVLRIGLPGKITIDSIIQLYEGRTHQTISFHPPLMSIFLGILDKFGIASVGFVLTSQILLSGSSYLILTSKPPEGKLRYIVAAIFLLNPVILIYTGIIWKDVIFAHAIIFTFLLIDRWKTQGESLLNTKIITLILLLTLIAGLRQQGVLFALTGAIWTSSMVFKSRIRIILLSITICSGILFINHQLSHIIQKPFPGPVPVSDIGLKLLTYYDLVGIEANGGKITDKTAVELKYSIHKDVMNYDPSRIDYLKETPATTWWLVPLPENIITWSNNINGNMAAYLTHRMRVTKEIIGASDMHKCLVIDPGLKGSFKHDLVEQELTSFLGLSPESNQLTPWVTEKAWKHANTFFFRHWVYATLSIIVCIFLIISRSYVLFSLTLCALVFITSYSLIGIACDFRYGYTLTVTTSYLLAWTALHLHPFRCNKKK